MHNFGEPALGGGDTLPSAGAAPRSLAERLWALRWSEHFPCPVGAHPGVQAAPLDFPTFWLFMADHRQALAAVTNPRFFQAGNAAHRQLFYSEVADLFGYWHEGRLIGVFAGNAIDWSTYYLRWAALLPEFRGHGIWRDFLGRLFSALKACGVERVEGDVVPTNQAEIAIFNKFGFLVTGYTASERWGTLMKFTKFLSDDCREVFHEQFCSS